jgi:hypothetical protein
MESRPEYFRYEADPSIILFIVKEAMLVFFGMVFLPLGIAFLILANDPGERPGFVWGILFTAGGVICCCLVCSTACQWFRNESWKLIIDELALRWSTPSEASEILWRRIIRLRITTGDSTSFLTLVTWDGWQESLPALCLGNLSRFCEVMHKHFPHIKVIFNGVPTCEMCGSPTIATIRDTVTLEMPSLTQTVPHNFCWRHNRSPQTHNFPEAQSKAAFTEVIAAKVLLAGGKPLESHEVSSFPALTAIYVSVVEPRRHFTTADVTAWAERFFGSGFEDGLQYDECVR